MYTLKDLSMISGMTDRTLRTYLKMGVLIGEKKDGTWYFDDEQTCAFLENEYVKPSIKANRNAAIFNFLRSDMSKENTACVVLHLRNDDSKFVSDFFCNAVNKRHGISMTFDQNKGENKVVLVGDEDVVYSILAEYHALKGV